MFKRGFDQVVSLHKRLLSFSLSTLMSVGAAWADTGASAPIAVLPPPALSPPKFPSHFRISGYGTLAYAFDNHDEIALIRDISQRPKNNHLTGDSWRLDSRLGLHVDYRFHPKAEVVAQAVLREQLVQDADSLLELAYLGLYPYPDVDLRLGRVGYDLFLMSDHRNLGYAYNWVRPPSEYYAGIPIFSVDGLDVAYNFVADGAHWKLKALYGSSKPTVPIGPGEYSVDLPELWSLVLSREAGPWRLKLGVSEYRIGNDPFNLPPLFDGLEQIAAGARTAGRTDIANEALDLRKNLAFKDSRKRSYALGAAYDDGVWTGQAEYSHTTVNQDMGGAHDHAYMVVGRRFGDWTPFVMTGIVEPRKPIRAAWSDWSAISQGDLQQTALRIANNTTRFDQKTLSLGIRWDFEERAALKLQWDRTWIEKNGYFTWFAARPLVDTDTRIDLWTVSLDFLF